MSRAVLRRGHVPRRAHPLEDSLALATFAGGLVTFVLATIQPAHFVASVVGVVSFLLGLYSQLVSATTTERWINVIGIGLAFVGLGMGLAQGGFSV